MPEFVKLGILEDAGFPLVHNCCFVLFRGII